MPRRSSGRSAPRAAPRAAPARNPPAPVHQAPPPAPVQASGGGSILGGIGSTIAQGMAFGTGSAVAHRAVDAVMGPRTIQHETVVTEAATAAAPAPASNAMGISSDACNNHAKAFQDCLNGYGNDISKCQFYMDMLSECRRSSGIALERVLELSSDFGRESMKSRPLTKFCLPRRLYSSLYCINHRLLCASSYPLSCQESIGQPFPPKTIFKQDGNEEQYPPKIYRLCGDKELKEAIEDLCRQKRLKDAVKLLEHHREPPSEAVYLVLLQYCIHQRSLEEGKRVYNHIKSSDLKPRIFIYNKILDLFCKCGSVDYAQNVFDEMRVKDLCSWNTLITGYAKEGRVDEARKLFDRMPERDEFSWTSMVSGYVKQNKPKDALRLYKYMQKDGSVPNKFALSSALAAVASIRSLRLGREIHGHIVRSGWDSDGVVWSALSDMYAKCVLTKILVLSEVYGAEDVTPSSSISEPFNKSSFPPGFIFGAASAAYQYEGAAFEDGKGPSIWDVWSHQHPEFILDHSNGDVADDFYHRYKGDVKLMKFIGLNGFRFSISWSRVLPHGKVSKGVNKLGIAFYNNLINELLANGITPLVTLFHWDTPQALEEEYLGFLSSHIIDDFRDFAELCFKEFGDRVKHWTTFNEPWSFSTGGYDSTTAIGTIAPGRCSPWLHKCAAGNSSTEPYIVAHHILLAHAAAAKLYRQKYKPYQKGQLGIVLVSNWMLPFDPKRESDILAAQRGLDFFLGWFLDPLTYGDYPKTMRKFVGERLPKFTPSQSKSVKGSLDFLGINYYTSNYAFDIPYIKTGNVSWTSDTHINNTQIRNGKPIGAPTGASILYVYPKGLTDLLVYVKENYQNPSIYITENGYSEIDINNVKQGIRDTKRVKFYRDHFKALKKALDKGVDVKGFFAWTFLDTYEWGSGYRMRFGLNYVDYQDGLKRYPKLSALYFKRFLKFGHCPMKPMKELSNWPADTLKFQANANPLALMLIMDALFTFLMLSAACALALAQEPAHKIVSFGLKRSDFPPGFLFGAASSAYQYEGAPFTDGKGQSIWDNYTHTYPNKIPDQSNGDVVEDFYHRYKGDIKLMKTVGLNSFRLSISWPRIIPTGKLRDGVNQKGIDFYNNVINELLKNGIEPSVTLFHWDLPQHLEDEYNGFLSSENITKDFLDFADICFKEFGDRVKFWATINEPYIFTYLGYDAGDLAPGRCSAWRNNHCPAGDSGTEPYIVAHNLLTAHAAVVNLYWNKYKAKQKGKIGIVLVVTWYVPFSKRKADIDAAQRALDFMYGWFANPLVFGDYPESMKRLVGNRLPKFTAKESKLVKGSYDFIGINYYSANYAANTIYNVGNNISYTTDNQVLSTAVKYGKPIGEPEGNNTVFYVYPNGLLDVLLYTKNKYNNPLVYIMENGYAETGIDSVQVGVLDFKRVDFFGQHFKYLKKSIEHGVKVKGFYAWTFLDTFEWNSGFTLRFGLVYIDYPNDLKRSLKLSALAYQKFLST
ncbi:OLC1v1002756C1 [Oldenlandia corymbosa var. corymbosa]|uniref:OLC1v1002756C1 n=1 Tax=Oldenlandia corymbosa var. corymbosa TaxID=529605 RepID=A0AAV1D8L1_OLDCO|nr:OLC1v1002756C1 [Oldenlandia corymbosa var. corymbosa]